MRTLEGQTVSIAKVAILGVGKNQMYRAVERGQVSTIKISDRDRVLPLAAKPKSCAVKLA